MIFALVGLLIGLGFGRLLWGPGLRPLRIVRYNYSPPVSVEPVADGARWEMYLASFGLQCALADITSEPAVVAAGIVDGPLDYRVYSGLLRRYGVWYCRGRRFKTRWLDSRRAVGVGRLRDAIRRGRVMPRWPSPFPPLVHAVYGESSRAQRIEEHVKVEGIED